VIFKKRAVVISLADVSKRELIVFKNLCKKTLKMPNLTYFVKSGIIK